MQPQSRERLPARGLALRDLVLVMREDEVPSAAVDVEGGPEILLAHRRALDVPSGPAFSPRAVPGHALGLSGLGRLPEREIERIPLLLAGIDSRSREQVVEIALR